MHRKPGDASLAGHSEAACPAFHGGHARLPGEPLGASLITVAPHGDQPTAPHLSSLMPNSHFEKEHGLPLEGLLASQGGVGTTSPFMLSFRFAVACGAGPRRPGRGLQIGQDHVRAGWPRAPTGPQPGEGRADGSQEHWGPWGLGHWVRRPPRGGGSLGALLAKRMSLTLYDH